MDFRQITNPILMHLWWMLPVIVVATLLRVPVVKGYIGELVVRVLARLLLDKETYVRVHNVTLPTIDGTTQIDHVFVSRFGIFVVETKNMTGWIFGSEHQAQWTQKIYKQTFKFQNPLRQNFKHCKALEETLGVSADTIHSVIVFVGGSVFKTSMPPNVTYGASFIGYIKSFRAPAFSSVQVSDMVNRLQAQRLAPTLATSRKHVQHLKERTDTTADRRCPKCGSALIVRTAKKGRQAGNQFWGCASYPACRYVQPIQ
jgi:restriction system protein